MIRDITPTDAEAITVIYNHYIEHTVVTFEEELIDVSEMRSRLEGHDERLPWTVYVEDGVVMGYAYASPWKGRCAYRYSAETTIYLSPHRLGRGIGTALYSDLLDRLRRMGMHTAIGGIALPNDASVALHEKLGFDKVAHFKEQGYKFDRWIDVGYWQVML